MLHFTCSVLKGSPFLAVQDSSIGDYNDYNDYNAMADRDGDRHRDGDGDGHGDGDGESDLVN